MVLQARNSRLSPRTERETATRLSILLGQVKAIERMLEDDRSCPVMMHLVISTRAAVDELGCLLWKDYLAQVVACGKADEMDDLMRAFGRLN